MNIYGYGRYGEQNYQLLQTRFGDVLISRNGTVNWPPRFRNLTLLNYFLWGYWFMLRKQQHWTSWKPTLVLCDCSKSDPKFD